LRIIASLIKPTFSGWPIFCFLDGDDAFGVRRNIFRLIVARIFDAHASGSDMTLRELQVLQHSWAAGSSSAIREPV